jgi:predicted HTH transcriptional regulator
MDPFPELTGLTIFPKPESNTMEFKIAFNFTKEFMTKIYATLCGFLNGAGGYMVFGIEDTQRTIYGLNCPTKEIDAFIVRLDNVYHDKTIVEENGNSVSIGTITTRVLDVYSNEPSAPSKKLVLITAIPVAGTRYKCKDGTMWFRLSASNYRIQGQSHTEVVDEYKKELKLITKEVKILRDQLNNSMREKSLLAERVNALKLRNELVETQFEQVRADSTNLFQASKATEKSFAVFSKAVEYSILQRKELAEVPPSSTTGWWHLFFGCCV